MSEINSVGAEIIC